MKHRNKSIAALLALLCSLGAPAQVPPGLRTKTFLHVVAASGREGLADTRGNILLPLRYEKIDAAGDRLLLFDASGSQVLDHNLKKLFATPYNLGAPVPNSSVYTVRNADWQAGLLDCKGRVKGWLPKNYVSWQLLSGAVALHDEKADQWALFDTSLRLRNRLPYALLSSHPSEAYPDYREQYCVVRDFRKERYGIGNYAGKLLVPIRYDEVRFSPEYNARVALLEARDGDSTVQGYNYYHIEQQRFLFAKPFPAHTRCGPYLQDSVACIQQGQLWNYYDENGEPVSRLPLAELSPRQRGIGYGALADGKGTHIVFDRRDSILWRSADTALLWPGDGDRAVFFCRGKGDSLHTGLLNWRSGQVLLPGVYSDLKLTPQPGLLIANRAPKKNSWSDPDPERYYLENEQGRRLFPLPVSATHSTFSGESALLLTPGRNGAAVYYLYHYATGTYTKLPYAGASFVTLTWAP